MWVVHEKWWGSYLGKNFGLCARWGVLGKTPVARERSLTQFWLCAITHNFFDFSCFPLHMRSVHDKHIVKHCLECLHSGWRGMYGSLNCENNIFLLDFFIPLLNNCNLNPKTVHLEQRHRSNDCLMPWLWPISDNKTSFRLSCQPRILQKFHIFTIFFNKKVRLHKWHSRILLFYLYIKTYKMQL